MKRWHLILLLALSVGCTEAQGVTILRGSGGAVGGITIEGTQTVTSNTAGTTLTGALTVPANTTYLVITHNMYENNTGGYLTAITAAGVACTKRAGTNQVDMDICGMWTCPSPGTSTQNLTYTKTGTPEEGIVFQAIYLSGVNSGSSPRGTDQNVTESGTITASVTSQSGDLCLLGVSSSTDLNGAPSGSGQTVLEYDTYNLIRGLVTREDTAGSPSTTLTTTISGTGYTGWAAMSLVPN